MVEHQLSNVMFMLKSVALNRRISLRMKLKYEMGSVWNIGNLLDECRGEYVVHVNVLNSKEKIQSRK